MELESNVLPFSKPRFSFSSTSLPQTEPSKTDIEAQPWKYLGYRAFCEWSASDNDFFVLRRFSALNTRVILKMQDDITQLDEELIQIDEGNAQVHMPPVNNGSFRNDIVRRREELIQEAQGKLKEYNSYVLKYSKLRARPAAEFHERRNVKNWLFHRYQGAIFPAEVDYIMHKDDLIRVAHESKTPQRKILEKSRVLILSNLVKLHRKVKPHGHDPETTHYYDGQVIEWIISFIIIFLGLVMLIAPPWWLLFVENASYRLGIITGFITFFLALVTSISGAMPFECLVATAGYSAVLMVFMQFGSSSM